MLLLFKYGYGCDLKGLSGSVRAKIRKKIPVYFSEKEITRFFSVCDDFYKLVVGLIYGSGLRLSELYRLRVKDIDFEESILLINAAKGNKNRVTVLPAGLNDTLKTQLKKVRELHVQGLKDGFGEVWLPDALAKKYKSASKDIRWQWVFPAEIFQFNREQE